MCTSDSGGTGRIGTTGVTGAKTKFIQIWTPAAKQKVEFPNLSYRFHTAF